MIRLSVLIRHACASFVVLVPGNARTQQPSPAVQIQGQVVRADDGRPLEGVKIELVPPYIAGALNLQTALSDAAGVYRFSGVREGNYSIVATANGFVSTTRKWDGTSENKIESVFQRVTNQTRLQGVDFRLEPEATIQGSVVSSSQRPVEAGISVAAVRKETREDGSQRLLPVSAAQTDERGHFVLKGLPAGTFFVCVNGPQGFGLHPGASDGYKETWYGATPSIAGSVPLLIHQGQDLTGLQIAVEHERRYMVTVRPSGPSGDLSVDRYDVTLQNRNHSSTHLPDGSYVIPDIPPGRYTLVSTAWSGVTYVGQGEVEFSVVDADVKVTVAVGGLSAIKGVVTEDAGADRLVANLVVGITSTEGAAQGNQVLPDRSFRFDRVLPGHYTFRLLTKADGLEVNSIRCRGAEVNPGSPLLVEGEQRITDCILNLVRH